MSKFLVNLLVQISKALVNLKMKFLIQKFFFFAFGPANITATRPLAQPAPLAPSSHGLKPPLPTHLARASVASSRMYVFPFGSRLPSWSLLSRLSVKWARAVSFIFLPRPANRYRFLSLPPATPRRPASNLEITGEVFTPRLDSPP
jgi:hypothetical protein